MKVYTIEIEVSPDDAEKLILFINRFAAVPMAAPTEWGGAPKELISAWPKTECGFPLPMATVASVWRLHGSNVGLRIVAIRLHAP